MSDLSELRLTEILEQYPGVPRDVLAPAIDGAGLVDVTHLGQLVRAFQAGQSGRVDRQAGEKAAQIQNLTAAYAEAKGRGDCVAMITLKSRVFELGGVV